MNGGGGLQDANMLYAFAGYSSFGCAESAVRAIGGYYATCESSFDSCLIVCSPQNRSSKEQSKVCGRRERSDKRRRRDPSELQIDANASSKTSNGISQVPLSYQRWV